MRHFMKKLITAIILVLMSQQSLALTLQECQRYSEEEIVNRLMYAIALGAQSGTGNEACRKTAETLNVKTVKEDLAQAPAVEVVSYKFKGFGEASEATLYNQVAYYEAQTADGKVIQGSFTYRRHENFIDPTSINTKKCASVQRPPSPFFILSRCLR